jgi:4-amino-4-deoxy-L-arabinose transferase-like glycosyltransferase
MVSAAPGRVADRPAVEERAAPARYEVLYRFGVAVLAALFLVTVVPHLGSDPIVGGDEGWIVSSSAKLAEKGVFGSDLFNGFYGSEEHYYFNLPLHHLMLAGVFKVLGVGVAQARLVSVVFGLATLVLTYLLGRRLGGPAVGLLSAGLLVLLRLNLTPFSGLTLTDLGATVRYDLVAVPFGLGAVLVLLGARGAVSHQRAAVAGLLLGLGCLTQFLDAFLAWPLALYLLTLGPSMRRRLAVVAVFAIAALVPFLPYRIYLGQHWEDFLGQARSVEQRTDFLSPSFYWGQLQDEPERYKLSTGLQRFPSTASDALSRPSARLTLFLVGPAALAYVIWRGRRDPARRLVGFVLISLLVQLALFESTKRFVYWVIAVPFLCVAIGDLCLAVWNWRPPQPARTWAARAVAAFVLCVFAVEGLAVAAKDVRDAREAPSYEELGRRLEERFPAPATLLGDNRLWPALQDRDLRSLLLLFYETNPRISRERTTDMFGAIQKTEADYILISPLSLEILSRLSPKDKRDFERFLETNTDWVDTIDYPVYGPIQVFRVRRIGQAILR